MIEMMSVDGLKKVLCRRSASVPVHPVLEASCYNAKEKMELMEPLISAVPAVSFSGEQWVHSLCSHSLLSVFRWVRKEKEWKLKSTMMQFQAGSDRSALTLATVPRP